MALFRMTPEQLHERRWWTLGVLCLGRKESLRFTAFEHEFATLSARERIYRRNK